MNFKVVVFAFSTFMFWAYPSLSLAYWCNDSRLSAYNVPDCESIEVNALFGGIIKEGESIQFHPNLPRPFSLTMTNEHITNWGFVSYIGMGLNASSYHGTARGGKDFQKVSSNVSWATYPSGRDRRKGKWYNKLKLSGSANYNNTHIPLITRTVFTTGDDIVNGHLFETGDLKYFYVSLSNPWLEMRRDPSCYYVDEAQLVIQCKPKRWEQGYMYNNRYTFNPGWGYLFSDYHMPYETVWVFFIEQR